MGKFSPALYAGGTFDAVGGAPASKVARWNGTEWSALGAGIDGDNDPLIAGVYELAVHDVDGPGPEPPTLYAGGSFDFADGRPSHNIARWDGRSWSPVAEGRGFVNALASFDGVGGPALYAGGLADNYECSEGICDQISRWDGALWTTIGGRLKARTYSAPVTTIRVHDGGNGSTLWIGGRFESHEGAPLPFYAWWNGQTWATFGDGANGYVRTLVSAPINGEHALVVAGEFSEIHQPNGDPLASKFSAALIDGRWRRLDTGFSSEVRDSIVLDDGAGARLYAIGAFQNAGDAHAPGIARWDGESWSRVGSGVSGNLYAAAAFDEGNGQTLYVCGSNLHLDGQEDRTGGVARWKNGEWSYVGSALNPVVRITANHREGLPSVVIAETQRLFQWSGDDWSLLAEITGFGSPQIRSMVVCDLGLGPALYVGGRFDSIGGTLARNIASWDGSKWLSLGEGVTHDEPTLASVSALEVFDDGSSPRLYVGGNFTMAGGQPAGYLAAWDGNGWAPLGDTRDPGVAAIAVADDGRGPALFVAGSFDRSPDPESLFDTMIVKWDGRAWSELGSGMTGLSVYSLLGFDDGRGPAVFVGGDFTTAGGHNSRNFARWGCTRTCPADCDLSGDITILDFVCFQTAFHDGAPYADLNADGILNVFDFLAFQTAFGNGCE